MSHSLRKISLSYSLRYRHQITVRGLAGVEDVRSASRVAEPGVGHGLRQVGVADDGRADVAAVADLPLLTANRLA